MSGRLPVLALALLVLAPLLPGPALSAAIPPPEPAPSPWDRVWETDVSETEATRFTSLWLPRLRNVDWFTSYMAQQGTSEAIAAEGFHGRDTTAEDAKYLVDRLVDEFAAQPDVEAAMAALPPAEAQQRLDELKSMTYMVVFAKDQLQQEFGAPTPETQGATSPPTPEQVAFEASFDQLRRPAAMPEEDVLVPPTLRHVPPTEMTPADLAAAEGLDLAPGEPGLDFAPLPPVPLRPSSERVLPPLPLQGVPLPGTYTVCAQVPPTSVKCAPFPVPLGLPLSLDADGVPTTGTAGLDVMVRLGPSPPAIPPLPLQPTALDLTFQVDVLPDATQPTVSRVLPAEVVAYLGLPSEGSTDLTVLHLGVDGSDQRLPRTSTVRARVDDLDELLGGRLRGTFNATFINPGTRVALLAGAHEQNLMGPPRDPANVRLHMTPVPTLGLDLDAQLDGSRVRAIARPSVPTTATLDFDAVRGSSTTALTALLAQMPTRMDVLFTRTPSGFTLDLDDSAGIAFAQLMVARAVPGETLAAQVNVTGLPARLSLIAAPGANQGSLRYTASAAIPLISGWVDRTTGASTTHIDLSIGNLPTRLDAVWNMNTSPAHLTYDASAGFGPLTFNMHSGPGNLRVRGSAAALPAWLQARFLSDVVELDARTSATAALGSGSIGTLALAFATDGALLTGQPSDDHLTFQQLPSGVARADFLYHGMRYAKGDFRNGDVVLDVRSVTPRLFRVDISTPDGRGVGLVDSLPATLLLVMDTTQQAMTWDASSPITLLTLGVQTDDGSRTWDGFVSIQGVPAKWDGLFQERHTLVRGLTGALGTLSGWITNHGVVTTLPGDHVSVEASEATGDIDASLRLRGLTKFELVQPGGSDITAELKAAPGQPFRVHVDSDIRTGSAMEAARVEAVLSPMPSSLWFEQVGYDLEFQSSANFDVSGTIDIGHPSNIAATPSPPLVRGLSARDGSVCGACPMGIKTRIFLEGLPTGFVSDAANTTVSMTNFRPPPDGWVCYDEDEQIQARSVCVWQDRDSLTLDAELDNVISPAMKARVVQDGIPNPVSLAFGPIIRDTVPQGERTRITYTATAGLGPFTADATFGADSGRIEISNIPASLVITAIQGNPTSSVTVAAAAPIQRIFAGARAAITDVTFAGGVELLEVPSSIALTFGKVWAQVGPDHVEAPGLTYAANADTLDLHAWADATLFGGDAAGRVRLDVVNLGRTTSMALSGQTLGAVSTPSTTLLEMHVWVTYTHMEYFSGCWPQHCPGNRLEYGDHAGVVPLVVEDLSLKLTGLQSLTVKMDFVSSVQGNYGSFSLGWASAKAKPDVHARLTGCVDVFIGSGCANIATFQWHPANSIPINVLFHRGTNHYGDWFDICILFLVELQFDIMPHPHGLPTWNSVTTTASSAEGGAWVITPNPMGLMPWKVAEIIASSKSPLGGGVDVDVGAFC